MAVQGQHLRLAMPLAPGWAAPITQMPKGLTAVPLTDDMEGPKC